MSDVGVFLMSKEGIMALVSAMLTVISVSFFVKDYLSKNAEPYLWAWGIRLIICGLACASQVAQGATYSLALSFAQLLGCGVIAALVIRRGFRATMPDRTDMVALLCAGAGLVVWMASGNAIFGILGVILADFSATAIGVRAMAHGRGQESMRFWLCALAAATTAMLAANGAHWSVVLVPAFSCVNALMNLGAGFYYNHQRQLRAAV